MKMLLAPKLPTYSLCIDDCLYSRRCMCARTLIPPPAERAKPARPHLCEHTHEVGATMTVYIAGGACVLGPYPPPSSRARPHLCERTYDGGTPINGLNIISMGVFRGSGVILDHFWKKNVWQKIFFIIVFLLKKIVLKKSWWKNH